MTTNRSHPIFPGIRFLLRVFFVSACVSALFCPPTWAQATHPLDSEHWVLVKMGRQRTRQSGAYIEFNTTENRFSGYTGCNWMGGTVEVSGKRVRFTSIGATKMACKKPPGAMKLETKYLQYLSEITRYRQKGETLRLYARNRPLFRFVAMEAGSHLGVSG